MSDRPTSHTITVRARYHECDPMGLVHHAVYPVWLEMARTELLRASGMNYARMERDGIAIVVARLSVSYRRPLRYDEQVEVTAELRRVSAAKIEHDYTLRRDGELAATASTVLACVDREGRIIPATKVLGMEIESA